MHTPTAAKTFLRNFIDPSGYGSWSATFRNSGESITRTSPEFIEGCNSLRLLQLLWEMSPEAIAVRSDFAQSSGIHDGGHAKRAPSLASHGFKRLRHRDRRW